MTEPAAEPPKTVAAPSPPRASMDAEGLLSFFEKVGFRGHRSASAHWYVAGPRFLMSLPSHSEVSVDKAELADIFRKTRVAGIRYISAPGEGGRASYQIVASGSEYSLAKLSGNTRSKTRRGLKRNEIRPVTGAEVAEHGHKAVTQTLERQGRSSDEAVAAWRRLLAAADAEPAAEIWGAWHEGELAAYLLMLHIDDVCEFYQARSRNDLLQHYPNNALIHTLTEEILVKRAVREITFGIESAEDVSALDTFKFSMGYTRKLIHQKVVFHPALRPALALAPLRAAIHRRAVGPDASVVWRKASGLIRFAGYDPLPAEAEDS